eukprot:GFUD01005869.1.p1 GENE.GFUD01005869.1~~GFUD01005869.1.p1  ORF type:complete len:775 (+),score=162.24 GFUD01005869.1:56-2380(+)
MGWALPRWAWLLAFLFGCTCGSPQSNYDLQALSVEYEGAGLPEFGTLNGTVTELDSLSSTINLNRTDAALNCSSGFMSIELKFRQKFYGIVYADYDRNSACKVSGNGEEKTKIQLPLKGCGTVQSPLRVFTNNIIVRFHPGLEIEGDEVITVICRYPPPIVQPPVIPALLQLPDTPVLALQPLREFEILLIICAIIFLALLLLGIGCSYYCLKKRNIRVIRRRPASTIGSEVTRISDPPSMFAGLKIPRAHATDTSGSDELTESVHTDYGSDVTSIATVEEFQSAYSDLGGEVEENIVYPDLHEPPLPAFDTKMRIKKKAKTLTPMSSRASSVTEEMLAAQEQYLTTILERTETNTMETLERVRKSKAELGPPPVHARLRVQHKAESVTGRESDSESQYSHDPLGTDLDFTEDEREIAQVHVERSARKALVQSDRLQSARLVESVQTRESEMITRREEEIRERNAAHAAHSAHAAHAAHSAHAAHKTQAGFDVTVRTTEGHLNYSDEDTASMSEYTTQDPIEPILIDRSHYSKSELRDMQHMRSDYAHMAQMQHMATGSQRQISKFDVLIRVLDAPPIGASGGASASDKDDLTSVFSEDDRQRWRDIVTHDSTFRTMIESAQTTEEVTNAVSQIRYVSKYEKMFEPHKWDVIVRVLKAPGSISGKSFSSKSTKSYKTSKSGTEYDLRSVAETTVDFGARRSEFDSESSVSGRSGHHSQYTTGARSMADRSGTEITEYHSYMYAESHGTAGTRSGAGSRPSLGHMTSDEHDHEEF